MFVVSNAKKSACLYGVAVARDFSAFRAVNYKYLPSKIIRQKFLDYFIKENNHNFVRSSPVVPFCDPTVPFVNAGMNQFKNIFLGTSTSKYKKVANSQKCIRIGGKHNDLEVVGTDGYHHTFFEMLGNWSFGECSKKESCHLAWKLLTDVYNINKNSLYVTYFGGDESMKLLPDLECKEVWKEIGVPESRILPFGTKDNFWEMGATGPCGPCTEIHYDHRSAGNRAAFVNKGLHELIELWNIVFIEYNRDQKGDIVPLPMKHVDTGMGFERLVAVLQGKISNYDTDLFRPLFSAVNKISGKVPTYKSYFGENDWDHTNTGYRVLADHARMVCISLADGMIPEQNQKLRKVMRRAFVVSANTFKQEKGLLRELSNYVIENLGSFYPELENNSMQIQQIIDYEEDVYRSLRINASGEWTKITTEMPSLSHLDMIEMPGLVHAYREIQNANITEISPEFGFKLFDTYGLDEETIGKLSGALKIEFNPQSFRDELDNVKSRSKKLSHIQTEDLAEKFASHTTKDEYKYEYSKSNNKYVFNELNIEVVKILKDGEFVETVTPNSECMLILDKTNLYSESGGQVSDVGRIKFEMGHFEVYDLKNVNNCVLHKGILKSKLNLSVGVKGTLKFDKDSRLSNMRNHTAVHLLNALLKEQKGATCQKSSRVTNKYFNLDVGVFSNKLTIPDIVTIEDRAKKIINDALDVNSRKVDSFSLANLDKVTLIPGEVYPESDIRLIEIAQNNRILSREPCCGTHVLNTGDLEDFCIISFKSLGRSTTSLHGVTSDRAKLARANGEELSDHVAQLQKNVDDNIDKPDVLELAVATLKQRLISNIEDDNILPVVTKHECLEKLNAISRQIKETARNNLKELVDMEMRSVLQSKIFKSDTEKNFIVHYLRTSMILDTVPLSRATKICQNVPVIVISFSDSIVKARCCVPEDMIHENFDAEKWLNVISYIFKSSIISTKGQDPTLVCNMKGKKVTISDWHVLLKDSMEAATLFAKKHL